MRSIFTMKMCKNFSFTIFSVLSVLLGYAQTTYNYTGAVQTYTVPAGVTSIQIEAWGAQGGNAPADFRIGGLGAYVSGEFAVTPGQVLSIVVGGQGNTKPNDGGTNYGGGGGGGSFVWLNPSTPLIIGGGGGGAHETGNGGPGLDGTTGGNAPLGGGAGGVGGNGGGAAPGNWCDAAGGGGWFSAGGNSSCSTYAPVLEGGGTFSSFFAGLCTAPCSAGVSNYGTAGGYGGGGACWHGGGGGGGYSGGGGGNNSASSGGGGGSYNGGLNPTAISGNRSGNGLVVITPNMILCTPTILTPDVASLAIISAECSASPVAPTATNDCVTSVIGTPDVTLPVTAQGTTTITWTYDDGVNTVTQTQDVILTDITDPVITCPADITVNNDPGVCGATVTYADPTATDNCGASGIPLLTDVLTDLNTDFANVFALIPNPYVFAMDGTGGVNSTNIMDGGNDMYDGGNILNTNFQTTIQYSDNTIIPSAAFGATGQYFTRYLAGGASYSNNPSLFVMAADLDNVNQFYISGNNGADGGGLLDGSQFQVTVNTIVYDVFVKRVYSAGDPSINHVYIIPENPAAGHTYPVSTDNDLHQLNNIDATQRLYYLLYAGIGGSYINDAQTQAIVEEFLLMSTGTGAVAVTQTDATGLTSGDVFPVGTTTLEYTATDDAGNTDVCTFTVTVDDTEAPTITCATPAATYNADAGVCNYTHAGSSLDPTAFGDNCLGTTVTNDFTGTATLDGATFPLGTTTVVWTAIDAALNTITCQYDVTVIDVEAPTITCATPAASYNTDAGTCTHTFAGTGLDPVATGDNCSVASIVNNFTGTATLNGATFPLGSTSVLWTVTDGSGNVSTCTYSVVVVDNEAPVAVCQNITLPLGAGGTATIVPADIDGGSTDNCSFGGLSVVANTFSCGQLGANNVTLTVLDNAGNSATCVAVVTVIDNIAPTAICQNITVQLDATGNATITGNDIDGGSTDNCLITSLAASPSAFTCLDAGSIVPVTLTVTDQTGNVSTCIANVTVQDLVAPTALCQDITVQLDAAGSATIVAADIDGGSTDNCGIASLVASITTFDCSMTGPNTVTLTVTDNSGNVSTCDATVIVEDNIDPVITCPGDVTVSNDPGICGATVTYADPTTTDNCGSMVVGSQTFNFTGGAQTFVVPAGVTSINIDAYGASGWTGSNQGGQGGHTYGELSVTPGQNLYVYVGGQGTVASVNLVPAGGGWNGGGNGQTNFAGPNYVGGGGGASDVRTVFNVNPMDAASLSSRVMVAGGGGGSTNNTGCFGGSGGGLSGQTGGGGVDAGTGGTQILGGNVGGALGQGGNALPAMTPWNGGGGGGYYGGGVSPAHRGGGGGSSYVGGVVNSTITQGGNVGNGMVSFSWIGLSGATIAQTDATGLTSGDVFPIGTTTLEYTATDDSGNTDVCTFNVTVTDNEAPVAVCQPITVQLDASGNATIAAADVDGGSTDNCGIASLSIDVTAFTCANIGPNNVTLTVEDIYGNSATCVAVVTVQDNVNPTVTCNDFTVVLDAAGNATITTDDIGGLTAADVCGIASVTASQTTFTCGDVGTVPVTLTVTDNNGNVTNCIANVTVEDNVAPTAICAAGPIVFALDASGNVTITGADIDGGSADACGIASLVASPSTFTCAEIGTQNVTLTVTDANGNVSTCNTTVEIEDQTAPVITCPADISVNAILNNCGRTVTYNFNVVDACATVTQIDGSGLSSGSLFPVGTTVQTYEVTDQTGTYTCSFNVTVNDIQDPIITNCPSDIVVSNDAGSCDARVLWIEPIASDNCPAVNFTSSHTPGDVFPLGTTLVTYTATDASGNSVTCSFNVTVNDTEAPTIVACTPDVIASNDAGDCGAIVTFTAPTYTENCTMGTEVASQASGTFFPVGTTTVTWTLTDNAGNVSTCDFDVTVEDTEAPIVACTDITVQLDATGNATIVPGDINAGSSDNCGIASITASQTTFDCSNIGANTVTLTVEDIHGNVSTCDATVTVEDNVAPVAVCAPFTVQLDATGNAIITGADIDGGSTDACGIASLVATPNAFTCANVGGNVVTLTVTDVNGNVSTCVTTVTVQDNIAPLAVCQDITVQLNAAGTYTMAASEIDGGSTDNCAISSITASQTAFSCLDVGANTVTLTVTDVNGNVSTCNATVTVEDNVAPVAVCQDITVQLDAAGMASITTGDIDNGSNDACGIASMTLDVTNFDCSDAGPNTVTLTVTDNNGNVSTCTSTVTVEDNIAPVAICQDITVQLDAAGVATITTGDIDNGSNDACGIASMTLDVTNFDCSNVGANTVTLTVTDNNGNISTCTSTVTVEDNIAPAAICQNIAVQLDAFGMVSITASDINFGSNDACGIASMTLDVTDFDCSDIGFNPVVLTVTDNNGNVSTCNATVQVEDNIAPVALCQDITVQLDATGVASITTGDIDNGSIDACGIASMTLDVTNFDCSDVGANTVTLTVTDNNGNVSTCTSTVTVEDNVAPVALCQDITVQLDATGVASITTGDIDNGSGDACGIASMTLDVTNFDCTNVGANTVILTVTDNNGNVSTCTSTVTVEDNVAPVAMCQDITVQLDAAGVASITTADIDNGSNDACGIASLVIDVTDFDCSNVGANTVTLTVTDNNGNVSTCTSTVTVEDNVAPVAMCQDITVQLDALGMASITTGDIDNGSNDACGIASLALDVTDFDCSNVGANTVTLTVTDNNGNVSTCTSTVTVEDNVAPVAICQDITVQLDAAGVASITTGDIDNGSNDACGIASMTLDVTDFDCSNIGANTVTLTVTDNNGNVSTCTATVTVEDVEAPIITCPGDVLVSNDPGLCEASSVAIGMATATDNCSAFVVIANDAPVVFPFGNTTVTWTATDGNGNVSTCTQIVTVEDVENPIITCPAPVVVSTDAGTCDATSVALGTPVTSDNCSVASVTNNAPLVYPIGVTNVTWTVTDVQGNTATCIQTVTVQDTEAPVITCPADVTVGTNPGVCAASGVTLGSPVVSDNCSIASVTNNAPGIFALGSTTVTWTVTDVAGNTATCAQIVTVVDDVDPIIACPADVIVNSTAGICGATGVILSSPLTNDNCSIASVTNDAPATFPLGDTDVTWTVTDAAGNTAECIQVVTVIDVEAPVITCPADVVVTADAGSCNATGVALGSPVTSDNCNVASVTNDAPATFPLGNTTITWTVTDDAGNTATCVQQVTVTDNEAPVIACPADLTVSANGGTCEATLVAIGSPVVTDNCSVATITNDAPAIYPLGNTTVTWTAMDAAGNTSTCTQVVTVVDTEAPAIACPADVIVSADAGSCDATGVVLGTAVTSDNCSVASVTNDAPVAFPLGMTTVTWTVTDAAGNTSTCTQMVTVNDDEAPVITCPADLIVSADAGTCDATTVVLGSPVTTDNCSVALITNDAPGVYGLGTTVVTWTVVDGSGNTSTCTQNVTVEDYEAPTIVCPMDVTITADAGVCGSTAVVLNSPITNDNCSVATIVNDAPAFFPVGNTAVTWTVIDGSGNTATCTQMVTVTDDELPVIVSCAADITVNADAGSCNATGVTLTPPSATDNCAIASITNDAPAMFTAGTTAVTWTVTDPSGNSTSCVQLVSVVDAEAPVITCPTNITANNTPGFCGASVSYGTPVISDNCGIAGMTQTDGVGYTSGNLFPIGTTMQEYTVVDISGNTSVCSFTITVIDAEAPMITGCPADMVIYTSEPNQCEVKVDWTQPQATDNCPGTVLVQDYFSGDEFPFGTTTVTYTATDNAGNVSTCSFNITVIDMINPTVSFDTDGVTLVADNVGSSYQWIDCATGNAIPGATGATFTPSSNGSYAVIIDFKGCIDTSSCQTVSSVGIEDITFEDLVVYPNPSMTGVFKIKYTGQITEVEVFDMLGRVIMLPVNLTEKVIDGTELASGKYMLRFYTDQGVTVKEVLINR